MADRKHVEDELRVSQERLSLVIDAAQLGTWDWHLDTGELVWSARCRAMFGIPAETPMSYERFLEAVHPDDRPRVDQAVKASLERQQDYSVEMRSIWPDGSIHWIASRGRAYRDQSGRPIRMSGAALEVSRLKQTEDDLKRARAEAKSQADNLAAVFDAVPAAMFFSNDRDCRKIVSNRAAYNLLKLPYGTNTSKTAPAAERPTFQIFENGRELAPEELPVQTAAATGHPVRNKELEIRFADGSSLHEFGHAVPLFDESGQVRGAVGAFLDITERKRIETELRHATERFQLALRGTPITVFHQDLDHRYTWIYNPIGAHTDSEIIGKRDRDILERPEDADVIEAIKSQVLSTGVSYQGEITASMNGVMRHYHCNIDPQRDSRGRIIGLTCACFDLSDRKVLERERERLGRQRQLALDAAQLGWWHYDPVRNLATWDDTFKRIYGITASSGTAIDILNFVHPDDLPGAWAKFQAAMDVDDPKPYVVDYRVVRPDGSVRWIEAYGGAEFEGEGPARRVVSCLGTVRDVTERKAALEDLRESETRYRTLFETMAEGFALCRLVRDEQGRAVDIEWLTCNSALERLTGLSRDRVVGHRASEVFPEEFEWWVRKYERVVAEKSVHRFEHGAESVGRVWSLTAFPYAGDRFAVLYDDITARKHAEEALRQSESRYRNLAENLDREVQTRTRELQERTEELLRTSEGLRMLSSRLLQIQDEERRHIARELHDSAGQILTALSLELAGLREQIHKLSPQIAEHFSSSEQLVQQLHKEVRTTSYLLHPPLLDEAGLYSALTWYVHGLSERSDIEIHLDIPENFGRLPRDMELMVFRLVQESLINIHRHSASKTADIRIAREAESVRIEVRDQGKGIRPEELEKMRKGGSGVGIRGMRERVAQFGGELHIDSSPAGTHVSVTIPVPRSAGSEEESGIEHLRAAM
jgi:PAS domain S-box-containing protein